MFTIENAQLVLKDKYSNVARIQNLGPDDFAKIRNAIAFHGTSGIQLGWLASQSDMLFEDWIIMD